jgi:hypothetical protein
MKLAAAWRLWISSGEPAGVPPTKPSRFSYRGGVSSQRSLRPAARGLDGPPILSRVTVKPGRNGRQDPVLCGVDSYVA